MITTHDVIRGMALRLSDEVSHISPEELKKDAKQEYLNAEARFRETLKAIGIEAVAENVKQAAMHMAYLYGDLYAEKGIRLGMRFMAEQIFQSEKEEGRPV